jgi:hypothetical protein
VQLPVLRFALPLSVPEMLTTEPSGKGVQEALTTKGVQ